MDITINRPLVSIVVPCYNQAIYLGEALDSVLTQTYTNWECIIINDGSLDNSKQVALTYEKIDKRIRFIEQDNKGVSSARNNAIRQSKGKYILPLDADDKISIEYLEEAVAVMESRPEIKLVYCKAKLFGTRVGVWEIAAYTYKKLLVENLIFCTALFRRNDFDATHGYDVNMKDGFEDWEFWITFLKEDDNIYQIPKYLFSYRLKEKSANPRFTEVERLKRIRKYIYLKHKTIYDRHFDLSELLFDYYKVNAQLSSIQNSMSYRLGKWMLKPFWALKKLFK